MTIPMTIITCQNQAAINETLRRIAVAEEMWQQVCSSLGRDPLCMTREEYIARVVTGMGPIIFTTGGAFLS